MSGSCFGSNEAESATEETTHSAEVEATGAICCPPAAIFTVPATSERREKYFGYDDKTDMVEKDASGADMEEQCYWLTGEGAPDQFPPEGSLSAPSDRMTRDGAAWISVAVGKEAEIDAQLLGSGCVPNVTFESKAPGTVAVITDKPTGSTSVFKVKGVAKGETTIVAKCSGNEIGWVHVWCEEMVQIEVDVASVITQDPETGEQHTFSGDYDISELTNYMNEIFSQSLIGFILYDRGDVDLGELAYSTNSPHTSAISARISALPNFTKPYRILFYFQTSSPAGGLGRAPGFPGINLSGFVFFDSPIGGAYNSATHEMGHVLDLAHPNDPTNRVGQYPEHLVASLNGTNVMANDEWNLMGYKGSPAERASNRKPIRYLQWKACKRE